MLAELRREFKDEEFYLEEKVQETVLSASTEAKESMKVGVQSILPSNDQNYLNELKTVFQNETSKLQELIASGMDHERNTFTDAIWKLSPAAASKEDTIGDAGGGSDGEGRALRSSSQSQTPPPEKKRRIGREVFDTDVGTEELDNLIAELKMEHKCELMGFIRRNIRG
uniref:Uncharacterized protein n=1 Tax=Haemonchus contortus TaxID=6289 RepID=A0A7I4YVQ0_HAECO